METFRECPPVPYGSVGVDLHLVWLGLMDLGHAMLASSGMTWPDRSRSGPKARAMGMTME